VGILQLTTLRSLRHSRPYRTHVNCQLNYSAISSQPPLKRSTELPPSTDCIEPESYVTTDGQLASLSWNKAPIWGLQSDFYYCQTVVFLYGALYLTRGRVCCLQLLLVPASAVILGSESRGTCDHIFLSQIRDFTFRRLLRLAGLRWRYSTPPPHGSDWIAPIVFFLTPRHGSHRIYPHFHCNCIVVCVSFRRDVFTGPLLKNGRFFIRLLHSNGCTRLFRGLCLAKGLYATVFFGIITGASGTAAHINQIWTPVSIQDVQLK
jgi:hypothetical protein